MIQKRIFHFTKMISNERNHYHIFSTGNKESLLSPFLSSSLPLPSSSPSSMDSSPSPSPSPSPSSSSSPPSDLLLSPSSDALSSLSSSALSSQEKREEGKEEGCAGLREELMVFHKKYYYSSNMFLVLLGSRSSFLYLFLIITINLSLLFKVKFK